MGVGGWAILRVRGLKRGSGLGIEGGVVWGGSMLVTLLFVCVPPRSFDFDLMDEVCTQKFRCWTLNSGSWASSGGIEIESRSAGSSRGRPI